MRHEVCLCNMRTLPCNWQQNMSQSMLATQPVVTISFETQVHALRHWNAKQDGHLRLTLVSLLHEFGKVPPNRFPSSSSEDNCTDKRPQHTLSIADILYTITTYTKKDQAVTSCPLTNDFTTLQQLLWLTWVRSLHDSGKVPTSWFSSRNMFSMFCSSGSEVVFYFCHNTKCTLVTGK